MRSVLMCLMALLFPLAGAAQELPPAPQAPAPAAVPVLPQAPAPPPPPKVLAKWWKNSSTVSALSLSEQQASQIESVYLRHQANLAKLRDLLLIEEIKLKELLRAERLDEQVIAKQKQALSAARVALENENSEMTFGMRRVMTAEQWRKLEKIREDQLAPPPPPPPPPQPAPPAVPAPPAPPAPPARRDGLAFVDTIYDAKNPGIQEPELLTHPLPPYTAEARAAKIEGIVLLQMVIDEDGRATGVQVIRSLGYGLDESAVNTVKNQWRFRPAKKDGTAVKVRINIEISFRLS